MSICYKNLTEPVISYKSYYLFHPYSIKFVKNIIKKQYRRKSGFSLDIIELGELQCNQVGFLLPLRSQRFNGVIIHFKDQIVLVYSNSSVLKDTILVFRILQHLIELTLFQVGTVNQPYPFLA